MTVTMPQKDSYQYGLVEEYVDTVLFDTCIIIWKAEDSDEATKVRQVLDLSPVDNGHPSLLLNTTMQYKAHFGPLAGCLFYAFGSDGIDHNDAVILDRIAAELPCETELWVGSADEIELSGIKPANENERGCEQNA